MRTYLIAYDLAQSSNVRHALATEIMSLGESWARPLDGTWYVRSTTSEQEFEQRLRIYLDVDDGLLIQPVRDDAVLLNTALRWFRQRRPGGRTDASGVDNVVAFPMAQSTVAPHADNAAVAA